LLGIRQAVRKFGPDIVHAHANKAAQMTARALAGMQVPTVATVHGFKKNNRAFGKFNHLIAVSQGIADHLGFGNTSVIYNGVDLPVVDIDRDALREQLDIPVDRPLLVSVGRLAPVKAYDILIRAWQDLADVACLAIAGDGPERGRLAGLVGELGLTGAVKLLGHRDDVPALLSACDGLVISSRREGFPYSMVEALLAGKPVLSTSVPGVREWLPQACLAPPGDVDALARMIRGNLAAWDRTRDIFQPVWVRARRELTVDAMAQATEQVYRRLVED
jgi:glycosyltransferase involved in cell wall biosynthesis